VRTVAQAIVDQRNADGRTDPSTISWAGCVVGRSDLARSNLAMVGADALGQPGASSQGDGRSAGGKGLRRGIDKRRIGLAALPPSHVDEFDVNQLGTGSPDLSTGPT
jgi:hypothetical protein